MTEQTIPEFLSEHTERIKPLTRELYLAYWNGGTTGKKQYIDESAHLKTEWLKIYADADAREKVKTWLDDPGVTEPVERRVLQVLYLLYTAHQKTSEEIKSLTKLETQIGELFVNFRGSLREKKVTANEIDLVLAESNDSDERQEVWEASKQIGAQVADLVRQLVDLRNTYARRMGYPDHFSLSLALDEIDEDFLWRALGRLEEMSRAPYREAKMKLDRELADRFGCAVDELRPWHYADPFFQRAPRNSQIDLDGALAGRDLVELAVSTYDRMGLEIRDLVEKSDLFAREGKNQHGSCSDIDREGDVRVSVSLEPNERWARALLHEYGHAVYAKYNDPELPWLIRKPAHIICTEAVALLMGRLVQDPVWLKEIVGMEAEALSRLEDPLTDYGRLSMLILLRSRLTVVHFESELYRKPDQDLNRRWWELVNLIQLVTPPEGRDRPDWASKIHLAQAPVYCQNYILGELMACQLAAAIRRETGNDLLHDGRAGSWLKERLFRPGNRQPWTELVEKATGEELDPRYFLEELLG